MKVSIIGIGKVGQSIGYALTLFEACTELVLVNRTHDKAVAEALDLTHAASLGPGRITIRAGRAEDTAGSDIVLLCCSVPSDPAHMENRLDIAKGNWDLFTQTVPALAEVSPDAIFVVVTNPCDVLTYHTLKLTGLPPSRVLGTGTLIDSARYRAIVARETGVHPMDIRAYILGEHGYSQFPAMSIASIGGERATRPSSQWNHFEEAVRSAYDIFNVRGYTNYAIARAASLIVKAIATDSRHTYPVTSLITGQWGVEDVCLSLPCVVGRAGIVRTLKPDLDESEIDLFRKSAAVVKDAIAGCQS